MKLSVLGVKIFQAAPVSELLNLLVSSDKDLSFSHSEIEGKIALGVQVIVLDASGQEAVRLLLYLVQVGQLEVSHGKARGHAELPLDLIYKNTVKSASLNINPYLERRAPFQLCSTESCQGSATEEGECR